MVVSFKFFDTRDQTANLKLALQLEAEEGGYFDDMRVEGETTPRWHELVRTFGEKPAKRLMSAHEPSPSPAWRKLLSNVETIFGTRRPSRKRRDRPPMTAYSFVTRFRQWTEKDMAFYERQVFPHASKAVDMIMSKIVGAPVTVSGTITVAKFDPAIEHGFPFTLLSHVFLPDSPRRESLNLIRKTMVHECCHILQRTWPQEFHRYYERLGFFQIDCSWMKKIRNYADRTEESISNPDTWRHRLYGVPLRADRSAFLVTNLAVEPGSGYYRELAFIIDNGKIVKMGWLHKLMPFLYRFPGLPAKSKRTLKLIASHSMEGHPNEATARLLERTGL